MEYGLGQFAQNGFHRTSIEEICAESGVTTRYFYSLFGSKEALMLALFERIIDRCITAAQESYARTRQLKPQERVDAVVNAFVHAYVDDPRFARLGAITAVGATPTIEERRRQGVRELARLIEMIGQDFFHSLGLSVEWGPGIPLAVVGGANELIYGWLSRPERRPTKDLILELTEFFDIVLRGLLERNQVSL